MSSLGILLISGDYARAHYAFVLASGAAALGRDVTLFATHGGCHALLEPWDGLKGARRDAQMRARGVAGLGELRAAAVELGVRLMVCAAGLRAEALEDATLFEGVEIGGVASFLEACPGQVMTL